MAPLELRRPVVTRPLIAAALLAALLTLLSACGGGGAGGAVEVPLVNQPPTAQQGADQSRTAGDTVTLDGSASSDPEGQPLSHRWALSAKPAGSVATLANADAATATFLADLPGQYVAALTVSDGQLSSPPKAVTITVARPNAVPSAHAGATQQVLIGARVTLDGSTSSDPDGDSLSYAWTLASRPPGSAATLSDSAAPRPGFSVDVTGTYVATLVVSDGVAHSAAASVTITATPGNAAPVASAGPNQNVLSGSSVTLDGSASSDANGDALSYAWALTARPAGSSAALSGATSPHPGFFADLPGTYTATLVVSDGPSSSAAASVTITATVGNAAPVANAGRAQSVLSGSVVALDGSASTDANGDALSYAWSITARPAGSSAALSNPTASRPSFPADAAGSFVVQLIVNDGRTNSAAAVTVIDVAASNAPPGYTLVWADEFDRDGLPDPARWDYDTDRNRTGWYNNELQYYARDRAENARVSGGKLIITARRESLSGFSDWGGQPYSSARLVTRGKASWTYGFIEVRAKLPCGAGTWPAIWTLGTRGTWPDDGEIDIMEQVGSNPTRIFGTLHTLQSGGPGTGGETQVASACSAFHNYQLTWTNGEILIGVDNVNYYRAVNPGAGYSSWPFDFAQYLLLNIAIGGNLGGAVDNAIFPVTLEVEHVRVFQKP